MFVMEAKMGSLENIKMEDFNLNSISSKFKVELKKQKELETKKILLKIQRDLLALSRTIISDKNFEADENYKVIKKQIEILSKYMYAQIQYINLACEYENTEQIRKVINKLLSCEYAKTTYNIEEDYVFWQDHSIYRCQGAQEQLNTLKLIHNSELSNKTAIFFVDSLEYVTIRDTNWDKTYFSHYISTDLARVKFTESRNSSLKKLYKIFEFINSLNDVILNSNYVPETYDAQFSLPFSLANFSQKGIHIDANNFQKTLGKGPNSGCWI